MFPTSNCQLKHLIYFLVIPLGGQMWVNASVTLQETWAVLTFQDWAVCFFFFSYSKLDSTRPTVRFHPILGTTFNIKDFFRDHIAKISTNNWFLKQNQKLMITLSYRYGATLFRSLSFIHQAFSLSLKLMHMRVWILDCLYTASCIS